jgi:arylformamidase
MKFYDVTVPISTSVPIYQGDPDAGIESVKRIAAGSSANVSRLWFGAHTGTHVDAPNHFIDGTRRVESLDLEKLIGRCRVIRIPDDIDVIMPKHLDGIGQAERILFKTKNSAYWNEPESGFRSDFAHLSPEAAQLLVNAEIKLVGIDYLSIERFRSPDHAVHLALLEKEIVILEGLDLRRVEPGDYELICLPLKYTGGEGDGAPARTILREL